MPLQSSEYDDSSHDAATLVADRTKAAARSTWISVVVNIVLTLIQISAGIFTKSQGLIADGNRTFRSIVIVLALSLDDIIRLALAMVLMIAQGTSRCDRYLGKHLTFCI